MTPGERFKSFIDGLGEAWKDRLRGWMASWLMQGVTNFLEAMEPGIIDTAKPTLEKLRDLPDIPPDTKRMIEAILAKPSVWFTIPLIVLGVAMMIPQLLAVFRPALTKLQQAENRAVPTFRLDPIAIITAWRRDKPAYEKYFSDLKDQGWDDARIDALKFFTLFYPAPADLIRWQAREVFEPEMIERYGLDSEFAAIDKEPFYKAGMTDEQILNYWRAHWEHASWMQVVEMLHRGLLTEEQVWDWFRVVEIPPFWRQMLIGSAYTWPTRVDVRRWWDMRTVDETELRRLYSGMGYRGINLDNYVLWTKVYVAFPDLMARWKNGWITLDEVKAELTGYGMPADRLEELIQTKIKAAQPERTAAERDLTATDIIAGVKKGIISWAEGVELLMDLGYDEDEADFKLAVKITTEGGSPETFEEFKTLTQKWRKAVGMEAKPVPEELKQAAEEVVRLTKDLERLKESLDAEEKKLIEEKVLPEAATAKRDKLRVTLHRAEAELFRVSTEYDNLVAQWRRGG